MSAAQVLQAARQAGIEFRVENCDLALEAHAPPPADLVARLARHKPEIVTLLRPGRDGWSAEDWQAYFAERAGVAELDGGMPRAEAEGQAFECCVSEWLNRNAGESRAAAVATLPAMGIAPPDLPDDFGKNGDA